MLMVASAVKVSMHRGVRPSFAVGARRRAPLSLGHVASNKTRYSAPSAVKRHEPHGETDHLIDELVGYSSMNLPVPVGGGRVDCATELC